MSATLGLTQGNYTPYTNVTLKDSWLNGTGSTNNTLYLLARVYNASGDLMGTVINRTPRTILSGGALNLSAEWQGAGSFNTQALPNGVYTINLTLLDPYDNPLRDDSGTQMSWTTEFNITGDSIPPVISDVVVDPEVQGYGANTTIRFRATDNGVIDKVWITITDPFGTPTTTYLSPTSGSNYAYEWNETWQNGTYDYNISVNDTWSHTDSVAGTFRIEANTTIKVVTVSDDYYQDKIVRLTPAYEWLNTSWKYRLPYTINATPYDRTDKEVYALINFTQKMQELGVSGKLDINSIRIVSYLPNGSLKTYDSGATGDERYLVPFKAYPADGVDAIDNALFYLRWKHEGTLSAEKTATYYVYFDIIENGAKPIHDSGYGEEHVVIGNDNDANNYSALQGNLQFNEWLPVGVDKGSYARGAAIADIDGDNRYDLIHGANANLFWASQQADGSYQDEGLISAVAELGPGYTYGIAAADFDNDGKTDIIASGSNRAYFLYKGDGAGGFTSTNLSLGLSGTPLGKDVIDLGEDPYPDLVSGHDDGKIYTLTNLGDGTFNATHVATMAGSLYCVAAGDFDGDGHQDIIAGDATNMRLWANNGSGAFPSSSVIIATGAAVSCDAYDLDLDGDLDIIYAKTSDGSVHLLEGNGDGTFKADVELTASLTSSTPYAVALPNEHTITASSQGSTEEQKGNPEQSYALVSGNSSIKPYVLIEVQNWTGATWQTLEAVVDEQTGREAAAGEVIDLASLFNDNGNWNTSTNSYGWYRVLVTLQDPWGTPLRNADGSIMRGSHNFTISQDTQPPVLSEIGITPDPTGHDHNITIESYYETDDTQGAQITITYPNGTTITDSMTKDTTYAFSYVHEDTYRTGTYTVDINSTDPYGNWVHNQSTFTIQGQASSEVVTVRDSYLQDEVVALAGMGTWWDNAWSLRAPLSITENSGTTLNGQQVKVVLDTQDMISQGKLQADCDDLRFVLDNGTALDYYLDPDMGCGRNDTLVWLRLPQLEASATKEVYLYYNNVLATAMSDYSSTFTKESIDDALEASWHMDTGSGTTAADSATNGIDCSFQGTPSWLGADGGYWRNTTEQFSSGDAIHVDHDGDWLNCGNTLNNVYGSGSTQWTFTGWLRPAADYGTASNHGIDNAFFAKASDSYNDNMEIGFSGGALQIYLDTTSGDTSTTLGSGLGTGEWHFVVVRYDGTQGQVDAWIDGVKYTDTTSWGVGSMDNAAGSELAIGRTHHIETSNYDGDLDELKVYSTALTDEQVQSIYNRSRYADPEPSATLGAEEAILVSDPAFIGPNAANWSLVNNTGTTEINYRLLMTVEHYNASNQWETVSVVHNDTSYRSVSPSSTTNLATIWWASGAWNTSNNPGGTYRARMEMQDSRGRLLNGSDGKTMNASYEFIIDRDDQAPQYSNEDVPTIIYLGENATFAMDWSDNTGLSYALIATNESGNYTNSSLAPRQNMSGLTNHTDFNISINTSFPLGPVGYRVYGVDTYGNINDTLNGTFEVWEWVTLNQSSLSPNDTYTNQDITAKCQVVDYNFSFPVQGMNVSFSGDLGAIGWAITGADGWASITFQDDVAVPEYENITCTITDKPYRNVSGNASLDELLRTQDAFVSAVLWDSANFTTVYQGDNAYFYVNYTNQYDVAPAGGECNITFNGTWLPMTIKAGTDDVTWQYNRSFVAPGVYGWNVTCDDPIMPSIAAQDNITINDSEGPLITLLTPSENQTLRLLGAVNFTYNATDYTGIDQCWLNMDGSRVANDTNVTSGVVQNITYEVLIRGDHQWNITCNDTSSLANNGTSENRTLSMALPDFNLTWAEKPLKVYRMESGRLFKMSVTNNGTDNATNVTLNMSLPYGWDFSAGNTSSQTISLLQIGESVNLSWYVDINLTAPLGFQNVTINLTSDEGVNITNITTVPVGSKDVETTAILTPADDSCGFSETVTINATIHNPGENSTPFNVLFKVDGALVGWVNTSQNLSTGEYLNVSFTTKLGNESDYNISVETNLSTDTIPNNNEKSIIYRKYNADTTTTYRFGSGAGDDGYRLNMTITNNKNCTLRYGAGPASFTPSAFTAGYAPLPNATQALGAPWSGQANAWSWTIAPYGTYSVNVSLDGSGDYNTTDTLVFGHG